MKVRKNMKNGIVVALLMMAWLIVMALTGCSKQIEAMIHKLVRYRPPGAGVQREKRSCEHCQWRMNKEDPVVCGVCYREVFG